jgi:GNAT superfamily N-acetyltransferase
MEAMMGEVVQDAAPYPRELVRTVTLKDGFSARVRPIRPDDEPRLADLYQRFFTVLLVGVGRYEPSEEPDTAEVAFVVEDGWQGRGLGGILLDAVLGAAEARGIRRFRADVQADNHRMLRLLSTRTQVEDRKTEEGVTGLRFRRAPVDATPR